MSVLHAPEIISNLSCFERFASRALSPERAADIRQETALRLLKMERSFEKPSEVAPYGTRIAKNLCYDELRRGQRQSPQSVEALPARYQRAAGDEARRQVQRSMVRKAIGALTRRERVIVYLYYWEEYTTAEIGARLGITAGNAQVILCRARARMLRAIQDPQGSVE